HRTSRVSNILDDYKERVSYDGNGNILTYLRNGHEEGGLEMDNLTYEYYAGTNRLRHVKDQVSDNIFSEDIDDQPDGNYEYDEIGDLIKDEQAGILSISWNVYGKITNIAKTNVPAQPGAIDYLYDPNGNRVGKTI